MGMVPLMWLTDLVFLFANLVLVFVLLRKRFRDFVLDLTHAFLVFPVVRFRFRADLAKLLYLRALKVVALLCRL